MHSNVALPPSPPSPKRKPVRSQYRPNASRDKSLSHIFSGKTDLSKLDRARSPWKRRLLIGTIVFLGLSAIIAWAAFFVYRPDKGTFSGRGVEVSIEGPSEVESGAQADYSILVKNGAPEALGSASLRMRLPDAFILDDGTGGKDIDIGAIPPGDEKRIALPGHFLAALDKTHDLQVVLSYHPIDFNSEFQAVATKAVHITGSVLDITATGPKKTIAGEPVSLEVIVKNPSPDELHDLVVTADFPAEFTPDKSTPAATDQTFSRWNIPSLGAGKEVKVRVSGSFTSAAKGAYTIPFSVSLETPTSLLLQEKAEVAVEVSEGDLLLALVMNGKTDSQVVAFGDTLRYSISYRNAGDSVLEDASLSLTFATTPAGVDVLQWNDLKDKEAGIRKGGTLLWTKKQVIGLGKISPQGSGVVEITIPVADAPEKTDGGAYTVSAFAEATVNVIDGQKVKRSAKTPTILATLRSDTRLSAEARYYDEAGAELGSGPLPPQQGKTTTYRVQFTVTNSLHELQDLSLVAKLPEGAIVSGAPKADAGVVTYDPKTKTLQWSLNWMPLSVSLLTITADIAFTPTKAMVGKIPNLVEGISFSAKDKSLGATASPFTLTWPAITTSLEADEKAAGKGKVE